MFSKPYESVQELEEFIPPIYQKSVDQSKRIIEIFEKSFLTKNLSAFDLKILADAMYQKSFKRNDLIIKYGDFGYDYYILDSGVVEIIVYLEDTSPQDP